MNLISSETNKYLRNIILGLAFITLFLPFVVSNGMFFPFISGKGFLFRIIAEMMVGFWAILALRDTQYRPKFSWVFVLSGVFVFLIGLSDVLGVYPTKSIWSNYERMEGWVTIIHLFGYLLALGSVLKTEKWWMSFFNVSIFASFLMSFYGLMQSFGAFQIHQGSTRLDATLGNSAYLAVYLLFHIFLTLFVLYRYKGDSKIIKGIYAGLIVFQTIILYNTATRGALLGLLGGLFVTALFITFFEKERKDLKKLCIGVMTGIILLTGLFVAVKDSSFVKESPVLNRFATISLQETTTKSRFIIWGMAIDGFKERPLLGWGQENFNYVFNKYYNPALYAQEQWFDRTHNVFFDWLIAGGILGLLAYLSLFGSAIYYLLRKESQFSVVEKAIILGMLVGYFIHNFFVFDNLISYIMFFTILAFVHSEVVKNVPDTDSISVDVSFNSVAVPMIAVAMLATMYFVNMNGFLTNKTLLEALSPHSEGVDKNLEYYKKAIGYNSFGTQESREHLTQFMLRVPNLNISDAKKQEIVSLAISEMEKQIQEDPNNARLEVMFGTSLAGIGIYDEALVHLGRGLELSPNKQSILVMMGTIFALQNNYTVASDYYKKAFEMDESFEDTRLYYASSEIYLGNDKLVEELLVPAFGSVLVDDGRIMQAYFKTGQFDNVIKILEDKIKNNPTDLESRLNLATTYLEIGNKAKAIELIQSAMSIDPNFKAQGESYIQQINSGDY